MARYGDEPAVDERLAAERIVQALDWYDPQLTLLNLNDSALSGECRDDYEQFLEALEIEHYINLRKWAIKMADATGKFESGFIDGNAVYEGRYLQCIRANEDVANVQVEPLYCAAFWTSVLPAMAWPPQIAYFINGLGMCIPRSCSDEDAFILLDTVYSPAMWNYSKPIMNCQRGTDLSSDPEAIISIIILSLFGLLVLLASIYDSYLGYKHKNKCGELHSDNERHITNYENKAFQGTHKESLPENGVKVAGPEVLVNNSQSSNVNNNNDSMVDEEKTEAKINSVHKEQPETAINIEKTNDREERPAKKQSVAERLLLCFSLFQNVPPIITAKQPPDVYRCLNGIRVIATCCVVLGHTYTTMWTLTDNIRAYTSAMLEPWMAKVYTMEVYVDTFFILSAFLVSLSFLKQLKRCNGKLKPVDLALHYFNRYWRLTPMYMLCLMIYTNLLHYFMSGPYEFEYIADIDSCATEWWKNLLYVNTLFIRDNKLCYGISWYLAVDMQLFIIAPLFLYVIYRWKRIGIAFMSAGFCGGLIANIVLYHKLYTEPAGVEEPMNSFYEIYITPWCRCPVYFMGLLLGYIFYRTGGKIHMPKVVVALGWIVALSMFILVPYLPALDGCIHSTDFSDTASCDWSLAGRVTWSSLFRPMWGIWVCWLIVACTSGYGGLINTFLSWNFFVPLSKLTYMVYLLHIIVLYTYYYGTAVQFYFTHMTVIFVFFAVMVITYGLALIMGVSVMAPLMRTMAVFIPSRRDKTLR